MRRLALASLLLLLAGTASAQQLTIFNQTQQEPLNPPTTVSFTFNVLCLPPNGSQTVTVNWATANGTALAGADYVAASGTVTFAPGDVFEQITVTVNADIIDELDETFTVNLSNPVNATINDGIGVGTIQDNGDPDAQLTVNNMTVLEGDLATFTLTLTPESGRVIDVNWATANNSAVAPGDYVAASNSVTFLPGETTKSVSIQTRTDVAAEGNETFFLNLTSSDPDVTIADNQGVGTITNVPAPTIAISDVVVVEGNAGTVSAVFDVTLSAASTETTQVAWSTANQTAVAPGDYATNSGTVTFVPGDTAETVTVQVAGDVLDELDETFLVNLGAVTGPATVADNQGVGTISDDDATPAISIGDVTVVEGDAGTVNAVFDVVLSGASSFTVTADWVTADGSAVAPGDYAAGGGTVTFVPGDMAETVTVVVAGDLLDEIDESFLVNLINSVNGTIADGQGVGTITDDDATPSITIADVTVVEGDAGTVNAVFNVTLSAASGQTVTVDWASQDQTAISPGDYAAANGTVTFLPGSSAETITVAVAGDLLDELDETFLVNLTNPGNASISDTQGVGTITDDDATPEISIADVTVLEGDAGTVNAVFNVTLSAASGQTVTVDWASADQTAVAPGDYATNSGTVTFVAGDTAESVVVAVAGDVLDEIDETFLVNLTNPGNATVADAQGVGTITDDDATPTLSIDDVTVVEGDAGTVNAVFNVTLSAVSGQTVTVDWATADQTAVSPADFASASGTVTFVAGDTAETITVVVAADLLDEIDEAYLVNLSNVANATVLDGQGVGTITDDDATPSIAIGDVTVVEGDAGTVNAVFDVTLSAASGQTVTVNFATADGSAVAPGDYAAGSGTVTFVPGDASETVTVVVAADLLDEIDENYFVNLTAPSNATISDAQGVGTITDDDATPSIAIGDVTVTEGNSGTVNAVFTVTLSAASGQTVTVDWASADGTAVAPGDYATVSGTVTFVAGDTSETVTVVVNGDTAYEDDETVLVNLTNPGNATIGDAQGVGTIDNDDTAGDIHFSSATYSVGESAGTVTITVARDGDTSASVTVDYATSDGTATVTEDYASASGTLTFDIGQSSKTFDVTILPDALDEADETVNLTLSNVTGGATLGTPSTAVLTITDDDEPPTMSIGDVTVTEGDSGTVAASFEVTLSAASGRTVTADWASADGSATEPVDYASGSGTVSFVAGDTTETVTVLVNGDTLDESDENFFVNLSNLVDATGADVQGEGTIEDDENTMVAAGLTVDATASVSDGNGIFEPGETVVVSPAWENSGASSVDVTGSALTLTGPVGGTYTIVDATADYGSISAGATRDCAGSTDNCYEVTATAAARPELHWDLNLDESLSTGTTKSWTLHLGESFDDVPHGSTYYPFVETIFHNQVTSGCGGSNFCGDSPTTREQISVFLLRGNDGSIYTPPACVTPAFGDVPCASPFAAWINELSARGVTAGCGGGNYCPADPVTREQMSVFLLRTLEGPSYLPPPCVAPIFSDVPCSSPYAAWVNEIAGRGITAGCGGGAFCPADPVTRNQMSVFLTATFGLTIYGP